MPPPDKKTVAVVELESAVRVIDKLLALLDAHKAGRLPADRLVIVDMMANLRNRQENLTLQIAHMRATDVEVRDIDPETYKVFDEALKDLAEAETNALTLKKVMQIAAAVNEAARTARATVSSNTV
jgi:hypothetical protein